MFSWKSLSSSNKSYEVAGFVDTPGSVHPLLISMVHSGETVLEVGCSTGYIAEKLKLEKKCTVVGIEVEASAAEIARSRVGIPVFVSNGELPELPNEFYRDFDVILCADVIEHTCNPLEFIEHLKRYASPTGRFVFSIPNIAHWTTRVNLLRGKWQYADWGLLDYTHLRFFTLDSACELLREAGLQIKSISYNCGPIEMYEFINKHRTVPFKPFIFRITNYLSKRWPKLCALQFVIEAELHH
jgi:SAM-dependent methyltransferase